MLKLNEQSVEQEILQECCKENEIDINKIQEMIKVEEEYATKSRRFGITEKIKDIIESDFN